MDAKVSVSFGSQKASGFKIQHTQYKLTGPINQTPQ